MAAVSPIEREAIRRKAEEHASDNAGPKVTQVSLALDRLLDTVADVEKDIRDEGTKAIQRTSLLLVGGSTFIAFLNLFLTRQRGGTSRHPACPDYPELNPRRIPIPLPLSGGTHARHCVLSGSLLGHPIRVSP